MSDILIPADQLEDGFKKQIEHINYLLESSEILFDNKKYSLSLALSVLAHEEVTKLRTIRGHLRKNQGITKKEWSDLTRGGSHKEKLIKPSKDKEKRLQEIGEEGFEVARRLKQMIGDPLSSTKYSQMKREKDDYLIMGKLDILKQDSFYLNWKDSKWFSINLKLTKKQLQAMALVNLEITKWFLNQTIWLSRHPEIELNENSESFKKYRDDPLRKKDQEYKKKMLSPKFKKAATIATKTLESY